MSRPRAEVVDLTTPDEPAWRSPPGRVGWIASQFRLNLLKGDSYRDPLVCMGRRPRAHNPAARAIRLALGRKER